MCDVSAQTGSNGAQTLRLSIQPWMPTSSGTGEGWTGIGRSGDSMLTGERGDASGSEPIRKAWVISAPPLTSQSMVQAYGENARLCASPNPQVSLVFSRSRPLDLVELERLLEAVGWSRRPVRRVRRALENSLITVGLWRHDPRVPRLIGFARCTGDGVLEATIWDVAIHPLYQGAGLGRQLMDYLLDALRAMGTERVTLFADPGVLPFYERLGWELEPNGHRCGFWYAS